MTFSNRDIAFLIWLAVVTVLALSRRSFRESLASLLGLLRGRLALMVVAYAVYMAVVVFIAQQLCAWSTNFLKDTLVWFLVPGLVLLFRFDRAYKERRHYRRTLASVIGITAVVQFYLNLTTFSLVTELLLLPVLVFFGLLSVVAGMKSETRPVKRYVDALLALIGLFLLIATGATLVDQWPSLDKTELALTFALPIWLTIAALPFIFLFSLYANYEVTFMRINMATKNDKRARRRAKLALVLSFHVRNRALHAFTGMAPSELAQAQSWGEARRIIAFHRAEARLEEARADLVAKRLSRYADVPGTDWEGHPLDQREFAETKKALDMLATFHRVQYKDGRYRADLMAMVGGLLSRTFPETEIVMAVRKNGRAWYAWRRTVAGWCVGIGATKPPPDQWAYQGPEPPTGFPRKDAGWEPSHFDGDGEDEE